MQTQTQTHERRRVFYVAPPGAFTIEIARKLSQECQLWRGREQDQGYAYRVAGMTLARDIFAPLRAPHHTVSSAQIEGKMVGHRWTPGEVHLAHGGVLVLDQVNEFRSDALAAVERVWKVGATNYASRTVEDVKGQAAHELNRLFPPAYFTLVMRANPCPCGWRGVPNHSCACTDRQVERWFDRVKALTEGAERIDLPYPPLRPAPEGEASRGGPGSAAGSCVTGPEGGKGGVP